jgi:hypothetical protein
LADSRRLLDPQKKYALSAYGTKVYAFSGKYWHGVLIRWLVACRLTDKKKGKKLLCTENSHNKPDGCTRDDQTLGTSSSWVAKCIALFLTTTMELQAWNFTTNWAKQ